MNDDAVFAELCQHARETALYGSIAAVLDWDERTQLPPAGGAYRAEQSTLLSGLIHRRRTDPRYGELLQRLADSPLAVDPYSDAGTVIRQLRRDYDKQVKLPQRLVEDLTRATVLGQQAWVAARKANDFPAFQPHLETILKLTREKADAQGPTACRYDALLDDFEPQALTSDVAVVLRELRTTLVPLVAAIVDSGRRPKVEILNRRYPVAAQTEFGRQAAAAIGFDFQRGRLDVTAHPFCTGLGPNDCRITTRYDERFFPTAFFGILHEAGHGLYDQGLRGEWYGLPLGEATSLGVHESQSRMWENLVGRGLPFWRHFFPRAQAAFPEALADVALDDFHAAINHVKPSLIRVEADEATYNLHILIRFELEQALIDGDLAVADLPGAWNDKYREYLSVDVPSDADGVLQDVHWSAGLIGYFPTYSLGNVLAAQFFHQADQELGGLADMFARGEFVPLREWLQRQIHAHGRRYTAAELVQRVTGGPLASAALVRQLREKYGALYAM